MYHLHWKIVFADSLKRAISLELNYQFLLLVLTGVNWMQYGSVVRTRSPCTWATLHALLLEVLGIGVKCRCCTKIPPCPNFLVSWYHHGSYFGQQSNFQLYSTKHKKRTLVGTNSFQNEISVGYKSDLGLIYLALFVTSHLCAFLCKQKRAFNLVSSHLAKCISLGGSDAS